MSKRDQPHLGFSGEYRKPASPLTETNTVALARRLTIEPDGPAWPAARELLDNIAVFYLSTIAQQHETPDQAMPAASDQAEHPLRSAPTRGEQNATLGELLRHVGRLRRSLLDGEADVALSAGRPWTEAIEDALLKIEDRAADLLGLTPPTRPPSLRRKPTLLALRRRAEQVGLFWAGLDQDSQFKFIARIPDRRWLLSELLGTIQAQGHEILKESRSRRGPNRNFALVQPIGQLLEVWEEVTRKPATHTPRGKAGVDPGRPHSPFGRFVVAFFQIVAPQVAETTISNEIAQLLKERRAKNAPTFSSPKRAAPRT